MQLIDNATTLPTDITLPYVTIHFVPKPYHCGDLAEFPNLRIGYQNTVTGECGDIWVRATPDKTLTKNYASDGRALLEQINDHVNTWTADESLLQNVDTVNLALYLPTCRTPIGKDFVDSTSFSTSIMQSLLTADSKARSLIIEANQAGENAGINSTVGVVVNVHAWFEGHNYAYTIDAKSDDVITSTTGRGADGTIYAGSYDVEVNNVTHTKRVIAVLPNIFDEDEQVMRILSPYAIDTGWTYAISDLANAYGITYTPNLLAAPIWYQVA